MTWGVSFMYYHCSSCGKKFKYALDLMTEFSNEFGMCPQCGNMGSYESDGPRKIDDAEYFEVESLEDLSNLLDCRKNL